MSTDTPLKILHTENSMGWGGQEIRVLQEAKGMIDRGHEVMIACPPDAEIFPAARSMGIPATALPIQKKKLSGFRAVCRFLRQHSFDVINTHSSTDSWLFSAAARWLRLDSGVVRTRHISAPVGTDPFTHWVYGHGAHRVVTTGERLRISLIERNRLPEKHVVSVPTGIDLDVFCPGDQLAARKKIGLPEDKFTIGIVATLRSWKGHSYLIDAAHRLNNSDLHFVIVGGGPQHENIENQLAEVGLSDQFTRPGNCDNVADWLRALDLFVLPSYANEGVPQSIMQAMACGIPVISTPVGSIEEAVVDGQTGLIVPPKDSEALAGAIGQLVADTSKREALAAASWARAEERFGKEHMLDKMLDVFYSVCPKRSMRPQELRRAA